MYSVLILPIALVVLLLILYAFAHSRLYTADLRELERLHTEGLLPASNSLEQDYQTVTYLLNAIAPAVYMRQEIWVRLYYFCLRIGRLMARSSTSLEMELRRLVAYQSSIYHTACTRLAEIRN